MNHPTISSSRGYHHHNHYHPYSSNSRSQRLHYFQTHHHSYAQPQNTTTYSTWPNSLEYSGISAPASISWPHSSYSSTYPLFENDSTSAYAAQPPSYMLPDPVHSARHNLAYIGSISRPQQDPSWLDQMNSASVPQQGSPVYPLTPAESIKSYTMLGVQPGQHALSNERILPQPALSGVASLPSNGHETPPLSAVSHRSSHTWSTGTASHVSNASSKTSYGGSQDMSAASRSLTTCEDQAAIYPYPAESASPIIEVPAATLPVATDDSQQQQILQGTSALSDMGNLLLHNRTSRESLRTSSPTTGLYGYPSTRSLRPPHSTITTRLLPSNLLNDWNTSPTSSRNHSLGSHQANHEVDHTNHFSDQRGSADSLTGAHIY